MVVMSKSEAIKQTYLSSVQYFFVGGGKIAPDALNTIRRYV